MPARMELREDGWVIYLHYSEPWNINDLKRVIAEANEVLEKATHKVHMLANVREIRTVPPQIFSVSDSPLLKHPNGAQLAIVGAPAIVKALAEAIFRITRYSKAAFFTNEEDALARIRAAIAEDQATAAKPAENPAKPEVANG